MKGQVVCVVGKTRSGKDSIAKVILKELGDRAALIKFADPCKRYVEEVYNLPHGAMELEEYRQSLIPGTNKTFLDLLKHSFSAYDSVDAMFWKHKTFRDITDAILFDKIVILSDIRHPSEANFVTQLSCPVTLVRVDRDGCELIEPDKHLKANWSMLTFNTKRLAAVHRYYNEGSLEQLESWVKSTLGCLQPTYII